MGICVGYLGLLGEMVGADGFLTDPVLRRFERRLAGLKKRATCLNGLISPYQEYLIERSYVFPFNIEDVNLVSGEVLMHNVTYHILISYTCPTILSYEKMKLI